MTRPGMKPRFPGPLENKLTIMRMDRLIYIYIYIIHDIRLFCIFVYSDTHIHTHIYNYFSSSFFPPSPFHSCSVQLFQRINPGILSFYKNHSLVHSLKNKFHLFKMLVGWLVWVLWHINPCRLFSTKSTFIQIISFI